MVEKWLLQVEDVMINSLRKVISQSVDAYRITERGRWVLDWPGQVVLCASSIFWTSEVMEAMTIKGGVGVSFHTIKEVSVCSFYYCDNPYLRCEK